MRSHIGALFQTSYLEADNEESEIRAAEAALGRRSSNRKKSKHCAQNVAAISGVTTSQIAHGSYDDLWLTHEHHWKAFSASPPIAVSFDAIPFPPCDQDILEFTAKLNRLDRDMKAAYRLACRRFHPDKFMQTFGPNISDPDTERIMSRLNAITQAINEQYSQSKRCRRIFSEPPR